MNAREEREALRAMGLPDRKFEVGDLVTIRDEKILARITTPIWDEEWWYEVEAVELDGVWPREVKECDLRAAGDAKVHWVYDDGGRADAGYKGATGDCVCRAIAIATEQPYQVVYDALNAMGKQERVGKRQKRRSSARTGVYPKTIRKYMESIGWEWVPTMQIGQGCTVHLKAEELPKGRLVVSVSKHEVAVIDGVIHDTYDPSRDGTRCVYGYYREGGK